MNYALITNPDTSWQMFSSISFTWSAWKQFAIQV